MSGHTADVVHVCDRSNLATLKGGERGNVWWRPALERFEGENGVRFKDGELEEVFACRLALSPR